MFGVKQKLVKVVVYRFKWRTYFNDLALTIYLNLQHSQQYFFTWAMKQCSNLCPKRKIMGCGLTLQRLRIGRPHYGMAQINSGQLLLALSLLLPPISCVTAPQGSLQAIHQTLLRSQKACHPNRLPVLLSVPTHNCWYGCNGCNQYIWFNFDQTLYLNHLKR